MPHPFRALLAVSLLHAAFASSATAQFPEPSSNPAEVMVLGVWHFENPGLDVVQSQIADVLLPENQAQIEAIADALARFRPTVVLVEASPSSDARLDSLYRAYRGGSHVMPRNEVQQLGFRLAASSDLAGVEPIDEPGDFPFGQLMEYAGQHDLEAAAEVMRTIELITADIQRAHDELTFAEYLRRDNEPARLRAGHGFYVRLARVGAGDGFAGANVVSGWYARNVRIVANIQKHALPGERVIVIFGSGHAAILRELIGYDPALRLVEPNDWLPME